MMRQYSKAFEAPLLSINLFPIMGQACVQLNDSRIQTHMHYCVFRERSHGEGMILKVSSGAQTSDTLPHHRAMAPSSLWLLRLTCVHLQTHFRTHFLWLFTYNRVMEICLDTQICWFAAVWNSETAFVILNDPLFATPPHIPTVVIVMQGMASEDFSHVDL